MSSDDYAIRIQGLSKCFQIYDTPGDRLKQFIAPRLQRMVGKSTKQYFREFWALEDITFDVKKGETVGIIGRNGSGKSTLLQTICGTLTPTAGTVTTNGRIAALLELGSGFNPEFTGRENVYMNAAVLGLSDNEVDARFDDIAAFADIGEFIDQPVKSYSSGMYVRLAFAVIAHVDADILVIDEALAVGDVFFTQNCMRFLREFMGNGTVLFVSHDTGAVLNLCQRAIWLQNGSITVQGKPKETIEQYLEKLYESQQGESTVRKKQDSIGQPSRIKPDRDMRLDYINQTNLRNDIELFKFSPENSSFGKGGARITNVLLVDNQGIKYSWVIGGESVRLEIHCIADEPLLNPIVGFQVKDRLGQIIFSDNTYLSYLSCPINIDSGQSFNATFEFNIPILPIGDYTITAAIAEGSIDKHIQHFWSHDALAFKVHSSSVCYGLVGIPMNNIELSAS